MIIAFVTYELIDLSTKGLIFDSLKYFGPFIPLMAIIIGFIPGCGPQIMITSMYVSGQIPMSAQIGNSISNDGDALFPAIAISAKAAIIKSDSYIGIILNSVNIPFPKPLPNKPPEPIAS